jgi:hypothetical protein
LIDLLDPDCSALAITKGSLTLRPDPGADQIGLKATLPGPASRMNPRRDGLRLSFVDGQGLLTELMFPPGAGWKTSAGPKWTFKEPPIGATLKVQFNAAQGTFVLRAKVKNLHLRDPQPGLITTSVVSGGDTFVNTQPWVVDQNGKLKTP